MGRLCQSSAVCPPSDEDEEDENALLFLPVSPEVDEPEDGWPSETVPIDL